MVYKLLSIDAAAVTRNLMLQNTETNTVEKVFDDSDLINEGETFEFMEIGKTYDCKLALFGSMKQRHVGKWRKFNILKANVKIGVRLFLEVEAEQDIYYISQKNVPGYESMKSFMFEYSRLDLIQVNSLNSGNLYLDY
ncbi:hypothetical protein FIV11_06510 [Lactiplantibacillus plantarum]|nr:hypothetical protein CEB41_05295 [Lactiplantibacillus plantarum]MCT0222280.1 hypothetical protein [Lactiplantibacillus plantarum]MCT3233461.1 hypothetical protein [Lactiplantibacillus plantarum]MCT3279880.1 hypothetical protein [Lactiplantibacillus plantarum]MCT3551540.1 hypothetical protein [Lactiplantibacillus plantarum]